jgi:hypothetical protein
LFSLDGAKSPFVVCEENVVALVGFGIGLHADQHGFDFLDAAAKFFRRAFKLTARDKLALENED